MKFEQALAEKGMSIHDLSKSQKKKLRQLEKFIDEIEKLEQEGGEEEKIKSLKQQLEETDLELAFHIKKYDVEKANKQREILAEARRQKALFESDKYEHGLLPALETEEEEETEELDTEEETEELEEPETEEEETSPKEERVAPPPPVIQNEQSISEHIQELEKEIAQVPEKRTRREIPKERHRVQAERNRAQQHHEEFEKKAERKPRKINWPLAVMGVGALILTWGAVNFFKQRD